MDASITIFTSIICSSIAALIVHYLAINRITKNETIKFRLDAYKDYILSSSPLSITRRLGDTKDDINNLKLLNDAKTRMILCASPEIVEALITYWNAGGTLERESELLSYFRLIELIRKELGLKSNSLHTLNVTNAIFKLEPSKYSYREEQYDKDPI